MTTFWVAATDGGWGGAASAVGAGFAWRGKVCIDVGCDANGAGSVVGAVAPTAFAAADGGASGTRAVVGDSGAAATGMEWGVATATACAGVGAVSRCCGRRAGSAVLPFGPTLAIAPAPVRVSGVMVGDPDRSTMRIPMPIARPAAINGPTASAAAVAFEYPRLFLGLGGRSRDPHPGQVKSSPTGIAKTVPERAVWQTARLVQSPGVSMAQNYYLDVRYALYLQIEKIKQNRAARRPTTVRAGTRLHRWRADG